MTVVAEILKAKPDATVQTIAPDASVLEALRTMADKHIGALLGKLGQDDLMRSFLVGGVMIPTQGSDLGKEGV